MSGPNEMHQVTLVAVTEESWAQLLQLRTVVTREGAGQHGGERGGGADGRGVHPMSRGGVHPAGRQLCQAETSRGNLAHPR